LTKSLCIHPSLSAVSGLILVIVGAAVTAIVLASVGTTIYCCIARRRTKRQEARMQDYVRFFDEDRPRVRTEPTAWDRRRDEMTTKYGLIYKDGKYVKADSVLDDQPAAPPS
jgi:hypothetical protein